MNKKILILGGGVAGCSLAYLLNKKGYETTIIEKLPEVGGLARTCYYYGHPYEFGPHVWFWPDPSPINDIIRELTDNELYHIDRRLYSVIEKDTAYYRYPIHYDDIKDMPDKDKIYKELFKHRDESGKLKIDELPTIGQCTFEDYFCSAIGETLYTKFMKDYSSKMWNIPGDKLQTSMVWADRIKDNYEEKRGKKGLSGYDPIKFEDHTLGKGNFQIYPKQGWNIVWNKMVENSTIIQKGVTIIDPDKQCVVLDDGQELPLADYDKVISTLDIDLVIPFMYRLPYTGRIMIPLLLPDINGPVFPNSGESLHFSGSEFQTRVTDMDVITGYKDTSRLVLIEVPITSKLTEDSLPFNTYGNALANNLIETRAYPQQSEIALKWYQMALDESKKMFTNVYHVGRHAEFRYIGMPETVWSVYNFVESL